MNLRRKRGKRIASWLLCLVMALTLIPATIVHADEPALIIPNAAISEDGILSWDLAVSELPDYPAPIYVGNASENPSTSYTEIFDFTDEGLRGNYPIVSEGIVSDITYHNSNSPVSISMHYDGDEDDYSLGIEYLKGAYNGICLQGRSGNTHIAVNSNCKIKYVKFNMSENKLSDSVTTYYAGYSHKYKKVNGIYQSDSNRAQAGRLTANGVADYIYIDLDNDYEYFENELDEECSYIDINNKYFLLAFIDSIEVTYEYITDENGWSVNISDDGIISWAPIEGAAIYSVSVGPGGGKVNGTSEDLNALCANLGLESGEYTVKLRALDEDNGMITGIWTGSFTYSSTLEKLSTPTNVRLVDNILKWNPVEHATRYTVFVYKNGSYIPGMSDVVYDGSMQKSFTFEAGNTYKFAVSASGKGYEDSEKGYSEEYVFESAGAINNVQISEDGILTWDPFEGAAMYNVGVSAGGGFVYETSKDLKELCAEFGYSDGTYNVRLMAVDKDRNKISETWEGIYNYISTSEKLATPTNVRLEGNVLKWDPVEHATCYSIYVYKNGTYVAGLSDTLYDGSTQKEFTLNAGNTYTFKVQASALNYEDSEYGISPDYLYKEGKLATPSQLILAGNILKWNAVADATSYSVTVFENETQIDQKTVTEAEATFALVIGKTYKFEVIAKGSDRGDSETAIETLTYNDISLETYTVKFHMMGHGTAISNQTVSGGDRAVKPVDPTEEVYVFEGWYTDAGCTKLFDFDTAIVANITIYAKWRCTHEYSGLWSADENNHWHECTVCHEKKNERNHDFSKYNILDADNHQRVCAVCGATEPAEAHKFVNDKCECGFVKVSKTTEVTSVTNSWYGVTVKWKAVSGYSYTLYRKAKTGATWTKVVSTTAASYYDKSAVHNTEYTYAVRLVKEGAEGANGKTMDIRFMAPPTISSVDNVSNGVTINWSAVSGASGYYVYRKDTQAGTWHFIGSATKTTFTDTKDLTPGTSYYYAIKSFYKDPATSVITNSASSSAKNTVYVKYTYVSALTNPAAGQLKAAYIKSDKATGYEIAYCPYSTFGPNTTKTVTVTDVNTLNKTIAGLNKGTTYYVKVRAYKTVGSYTFYSSWSASKNLKLTK